MDDGVKDEPVTRCVASARKYLGLYESRASVEFRLADLDRAGAMIEAAARLLRAELDK